MAKGFVVKLPDANKPSEPRYRLEEESTVGFTVVANNLTKEKCRELYEEKLEEGANPKRLKIVRES